MEPAQARLVFAGCLVGSNNIPAGTPAAGVAGHIAANPSLGPFAEAMGRRMGMPANFTQSARASVGLSGATSMMDATGRFGITYPFDPSAFADANTYIATGHEPEGVMRAVVEVISTADGVVAETQLRARLAAGHSSSDPWWDEMTIATVTVALDGVAPGAGVTHDRMLALAHMVGVPFLARWAGSYGRDASTYVAEVNPQAALATLLYREVARTPTWTAPPDLKARGGRLIGEQGWMMLPAAREGALIAWLDGETTFTAEQIRANLDPGVILAKAPALFAGGATSGRIRLALAWLELQPGTPDVRTFLDNEVVEAPGVAPELSPAVRAELGGIEESEVLGTLGRLLPMAGGAPGAPPLPQANAEVRNQGQNRVLIEPAALRGDRDPVRRERPQPAGDARRRPRHAPPGRARERDGLRPRLGGDRRRWRHRLHLPQPADASMTFGDWVPLAGGYGTALAVDGDVTAAAQLGRITVWAGGELALRREAPAPAPGRPRVAGDRVLWGELALGLNGAEEHVRMQATLHPARRPATAPPPTPGRRTASGSWSWPTAGRRRRGRSCSTAPASASRCSGRSRISRPPPHGRARAGCCSAPATRACTPPAARSRTSSSAASRRSGWRPTRPRGAC